MHKLHRYSLSSVQEGLLFDYLAGAADVSLEQITGWLAEDINPDRYRAAWEHTVRRYPALRCRFAFQRTAVPELEVCEDFSVPFRFEDWSALAGPEQEERFESWRAEDRRQGFELEAAPPIRVALFRMGPESHRTVWTFHHLLVDGRAFATVLKEVFRVYSDGIPAVQAPVMDLPQPTEDLAGFPEAEEFWRAQLSGFETPTPLDGLELRKAPAEGPTFGFVDAVLDESITAGLRIMAHRCEATLSSVVLAAWSVLLARMSGREQVLFGTVRSGRDETNRSDVGVFIRTLPFVISVPPQQPVSQFLRAVRRIQIDMARHERLPLSRIQACVPATGARRGLFHSLVMYDNQSLQQELRSGSSAWSHRRFELTERTGLPLTLYAYGDPEMRLKLVYDSARFDAGAASRILDRFRAILQAFTNSRDSAVGDLSILLPEERDSIVRQLAPLAFPMGTACDQWEAQAALTPDAPAVTSGDQVWTYRELDEAANRLAHWMRTLGIGSEDRVALCLDRSASFVISALAVWKAGAAYVPLDPSYPTPRLAYTLQDCDAKLLISDHPDAPGEVAVPVLLYRESTWSGAPVSKPERDTGPGSLAYVIYTSGSTGRPKGVMIEHGQLVSFFDALTERLRPLPGGTFLSATSFSFDISILELFWTLVRGFHVVLHGGAAGSRVRSASSRSGPAFSLFYFSGDGSGSGSEKYRLLMEGARFADMHGFHAVWTPERHFHAFGGLFPNPSVTAAAIAAVTRRVKIRAGSVVLPLHSTLRVAEEWSMVDNLSGGRVGVSLASGWQPNDFVLAPDRFASAKKLLFSEMEVLRRLWRGESVELPNGKGQLTSVRILPRPVQPELPVWITAAGSPDTMRLAGERRANLLTHLLGQRIDELGSKIQTYRAACGSFPGEVTLMLHTFLGDSMDQVREQVREPFCAYLRTSIDLIRNSSWEFPTFRKTDGAPGGTYTEEEIEAAVEFAFNRYFETSGLFGSVEDCREMVAQLQSLGVDEIACLIDFGVPIEKVVESLEKLRELKDRMQASSAPRPNISVASALRRYGVTHFQCTPSLLRMVLAEPGGAEALRSLRVLLVGGEALPEDLATRLAALGGPEVHNMYGPTETTIWSTTAPVTGGDVSIGKPLSNTFTCVVDERGQLVPPGVSGELAIGGRGVARGYWGLPALTADRFVTLPELPLAGRLYRTGDRVRLRPDGNLEFLGRLDQQVKIRGHRIEIAEVEAALLRHEGVREAAAVAVRNGDSEDSLAAYYVPADKTIPGEELRAFLRSVLPEAMVPTYLTPLADLPLTPNGKLDRKSLPRPKASPPQVATHHQAPSAPVEKTIAELIRSELGLERISITDNFFDLGAHSLLMVRLAGKIGKALDRDINVLDLFAHPTVQRLSVHLSTGTPPKRAAAAAAGVDRASARRRALGERTGRSS
ncbi:MAG: LLM class flavin-dependent oxidoreductase [Bryobacteraceae bacterium]|nr:LLM class flavin-dependent oxidoreductase [Bryobacteraceae bacterium]